MTRNPTAALLFIAIVANHVMADMPPPRRVLFVDVNLEPDFNYWWTETQAAWLGGIIGGSLGILGAAYGAAAGLGLVLRLMLTLTCIMTCVGVAVLLAGIVAVLSGQPYHVYFLLLVIGGIMVAIFGVNYPIIKRRIGKMDSQQMSDPNS